MTTPGHIFRFQNGRFTPGRPGIVSEYPLQLTVNGRDLATLIASPHGLHYLVAGFLRLQGFISSPDDILMLGICEESGTASIRIRGELPELLRPVLTSGCGTGITFTLPSGVRQPSGTSLHKPSEILALMEALGSQADRYRSHGGIHSAAVGRDGKLLLAAEDLGRHNTLDRIAGEALLRGICLEGTALVTSGRVSSEMAAKAAILGVSLIASRTSPTDMAVRLCRDCSITLAGYTRAGQFSVYACPEQVEDWEGEGKIPGVTGVILAGGTSRRMGTNKALLPVDGRRLVEITYERMAQLFSSVILVTNTPEEYSFLPCRFVPDRYPGIGSIAGLHAGLDASRTDRIFAVACDMPNLNQALIRNLCAVARPGEAVVPSNAGGYREPLHALYPKSALVEIEAAIAADDRSILHLLERIPVREVRPEGTDAAGSFDNINTPEEYARLAKKE